MTVWLCSNKECRTIYNFDPCGHCPTCVSDKGVGWSCMEVQVKTAESVVGDLRSRLTVRL